MKVRKSRGVSETAAVLSGLHRAGQNNRNNRQFHVILEGLNKKVCDVFKDRSFVTFLCLIADNSSSLQMQNCSSDVFSPSAETR